MFLSRLRIRGKLGVLVVLPLLVIAVLSVAVVVAQANNARTAAATVTSVDLAGRASVVVADLQAERLVSVGYLIGMATPADLEGRSADVDDQVADLEADYGSRLVGPERTALNNVASLKTLRASILTKHTNATAVLAGFSGVIDKILDGTSLINGVDTGTAAGHEVVALDALLHIDELTNESAALLLEISGQADNSGLVTEPPLIAYSADQTAITQLLPRFTTYATSTEIGMHDAVTEAFTDRLGPDFTTSFAKDPKDTAAVLSPPVIYPEMQSFIVLGRFAEQKIAADVIASVGAQRSDALIEAYLIGAIGLIVVGAVAFLGAFIARSVSQPLADLTLSTNRVARLAEAELLRVADDESESTEPAHFEPVSVTTDDEIGELALAFERISRTSVQLVGRQVVSRRNVAQMFGHVGRRTQNLVGRQLSLIDTLEAQETDARRLEDLYRLDHLTSRIRRNASSLVALSGASDIGGHFAPLPMHDVIRLALGEIEGYTRVDVTAPAELMVTPSAINDLILLLAEVMENATSFSPPHTRVTASAQADPPRVTIADHGIGLAPDRLDEENARLAQRERLDLAPTEVLGLFVVGRLARRHRLSVVLTHTVGGGVTVTIDVTNCLIGTDLADSTQQFAIGASTANGAGAARGLGVAVGAGTANGASVAVGASAADDARFAVGAGVAVGAGLPLGAAIAEVLDEMELAPYDVASLHRANRAIEATRPWDAFALQPALSAGAYPSLSLTAEPAVVAGETPAPTLAAGTPSWASDMPSFTSRAPDEPPTMVLPTLRGEDGGLTRRVPGATIRVDQPVAARQNARSQDPSEAWDLVSQFESGVARALSEVRPETTEEETSK